MIRRWRPRRIGQASHVASDNARYAIQVAVELQRRRLQPASAFVCTVLAVIAFLASLVAIFGLYFVAFDRVIGEMRVGYLLLAMVVILLAGWAVTLAQAMAARATG